MFFWLWSYTQRISKLISRVRPDTLSPLSVSTQISIVLYSSPDVQTRKTREHGVWCCCAVMDREGEMENCRKCLWPTLNLRFIKFPHGRTLQTVGPITIKLYQTVFSYRENWKCNHRYLDGMRLRFLVSSKQTLFAICTHHKKYKIKTNENSWSSLVSSHPQLMINNPRPRASVKRGCPRVWQWLQ